MMQVKPSTIFFWVCIILFSGVVTWFAFIKLNIDPYNLGMPSFAQGSAQVFSSEGRLLASSELISCTKPDTYSVKFRGVSAELEVGFGASRQYPLFEDARFLYRDQVNPTGDLLFDCVASDYALMTSQRRAPGFHTIRLPINISGNMDVACKGMKTGNSYHFIVRFQNCR